MLSIHVWKNHFRGWPTSSETIFYSNTWPCISKFHLRLFIWQSVYQKHPADPAQSLTNKRGQTEDKHYSTNTSGSILSKKACISSSAQEGAWHTWENEIKKTASKRASRRIARAPGLSCLYKQALIFLSSSGTSTIYSQLCGRGPEVLEKFCYCPVGPWRPVCENGFHL